jgi:ribosomal-protein-serine acetyltransferase
VFSLRIDARVTLRRAEEADAEELHAVVEANRAYLARWMSWAGSQTLEGTREFLRACDRQHAENQGLQTVIVEDVAIIGTVSFHRVDWQNRSASVGYWLVEAAQGRGTMTAAVRTMTDYGVRIWRLNRIEIRAAVENHRSRAIPARLGFTQEGVLRQAERIGDRFVDHAVYGMLAQDWLAQDSPAHDSPAQDQRDQPSAGSA